jgi:hypothetical protein
MSGLMENWLECEDYGRVDRLESEAIVTEFFTMVFPIWPNRTVYVYRNEAGEERRIHIPLDRRSVALGYARFSAWMFALIFAAPVFADHARWGWWIAPALLCALAGIGLQLFVGHLEPDEADRRALLRRTAGLGAPPELLPFPFRVHMCEELADRWYTDNRLGWREAIDRGMGHEMLVALAEYHCEPLLVVQAKKNLATDLRWN